MVLQGRLINQALLIGSLCLCCTSGIAQQQDELEALQQQIKQKQQTIEQRLSEAKALQAQLRKAELNVAEVAKRLNQTQVKLEQNHAEQSHLQQQQKDLLKQLSGQQDMLADQLRSAFMAGNYDYVKMLLNQQDVGKFERVLSYYQYVNEARQKEIVHFRELVAEVEKVKQALVVKAEELKELTAKQAEQQQNLEKEKRAREVTLVQVNRQIASDSAQVEQLQINEQALIKAIEEAQRQAQTPQALEGLSKQKGKLQAPTKGRVQNLFGSRRQGQVRWKGIIINGNEGSSVNAIYYGRVLYADWLRGFGLVTVIDHGDGYMSLYGHNQALLKQVGDTVEAGETIALVGQSGGQTSPNLYFEIRHKGAPLNPVSWLSK